LTLDNIYVITPDLTGLNTINYELQGLRPDQARLLADVHRW